MKYSNQNPQIKRQKIITSTIEKSNLSAEGNLHSLPLQRPLLLIGHGTKDAEGKQNFLDFVTAYQNLDKSRPVIPCFLELTKPTIQEGVDKCVEQGYTELSALPILLFAARHNKFDITNELDRARQRHPQIKFYYGRNFGITLKIIELWRSRLKELDETNFNCSKTVLLFVGRGSSDPDANGDVYKLSRMLWEGTGYLTVETCFIGITHPRLEEGFRRARLYQPKRILVLPYFLFTGVLVKKIFDITAQQQEQYPRISMTCLPEMGSHPKLLELLREREVETQLGEVKMNCEMCKFRLVTVIDREHSHGHYHHHHDHSHLRNIPEHSHSVVDPYAELEQYHQRIWQVP
jgi:sirohydrochlorin cobaltochelatase